MRDNLNWLSRQLAGLAGNSQKENDHEPPRDAGLKARHVKAWAGASLTSAGPGIGHGFFPRPERPKRIHRVVAHPVLTQMSPEQVTDAEVVRHHKPRVLDLTDGFGPGILAASMGATRGGESLRAKTRLENRP